MVDMKFGKVFGSGLARIFISFALAFSLLGAWADGEKPRNLKVLAIGNSFSQSLMAQLPACAKALPGVELDFATLVIGGCPLERHWNNVEKSSDAEFRPYAVQWNFASAPDRKRHPFGDAMKDGRANIPQFLKAVKWDIVTIQQASHASWNEKTYQPYADNLIAKIKELAPQAEVRVHQTWAYCNADKRICGCETPGKSGSWGFDQNGMHERLAAAYDNLAAKYHLKVIPSGDAVAAYRRALPVTFKPPTKEQLEAFKDGEVPDMGGEVVGSYYWSKRTHRVKKAKDGGMRKIKVDSIHLNREGQYLQACTWLAALFDSDLSGLAYKPSFLGEERAALMRKCAAEAVKARSVLKTATASADVSFDAGRWRVSFSEEGSMLALAHASGVAAVEGSLRFTGPAAVTGAGVGKDSTTCEWRVVASRDGVPQRLALADSRDNVHGYITFQADGEGVSMLIYHRTAFAYSGVLEFDGILRYRKDSYPCSLTPKADDRVLSVKSGNAVSIDDDALFSPSADEALGFERLKLEVAGGNPPAARQDGGGVSYRVSARLAIDDATKNAISVRLVKHWYKSRWVPNWRAPDRARSPHAPTGWLSWNTYFDTAGSKENLAEARFAAKWFKPFGMEFWNIESWQDNSPKLPVSNFHNMNLETYKVQFPEGMKWLADEIRKLGFRPGLWMAPYGTGNGEFYERHKDWFLHGRDGKPVRSWNGKYTLDPTAPGALEHLTLIFDKASHEWGYEFFKIDGMSGRGHGYCAHLYERPEIRAVMHDPKCPNPFERTVAAYRKGIGEDRVFLACQGHFTGAEAGYADASRTGADIVHPNKPVKWENILLQARCTVNQYFVHSNVFWSDPDCMLVSQDALVREQAQVETTVVALPGQQTFAGDKLAELAPDRVKLIQQALPVCPTRPGKLYPLFGNLPVWDLHVSRPFGDWHVVALFNWSDREKEVSVDWREIGERGERVFVVWEFWTETYLGERKGELFASVPPRGVRLFALQPLSDHPQFLTCDRHVTQGAVGLLDQKWDGSRLSVKIAAVGGFPQTVRFAVPEGWKIKSAAADGAEVKAKEEHGGRVVAVEISTPRSCDVDLRLEF